MHECSARTFYGYDIGPVHEIAAKVSARLADCQPMGADPMLDF